MNKSFFTNITIENFKSLHSVELKDCNRINVIIGKPNVGKSNILEALSLYSLPHSLSPTSSRFNNSLTSYIRYENEEELFFNGNTHQVEPIKIKTNLIDCTVNFKPLEGLDIQFKGANYDGSIKLQLDERTGVPKLSSSLPYNESFNAVKRYIFESKRQGKANSQSFLSRRLPFLMPPFGNNLMQIIDRNPELTEYYASFFEEFGLNLIFDKTSSSVKIMKQIKSDDGSILKTFILPYSSMADTLQRVIFYKTAIASNTDSVLLLEEPEAHSFPPYIVHITQEIINSINNQFFITTHSPFILNDLMQDARKELAVFVVHWKNGETVATKLTDEQLEEVYQYGVDIFTNIENYFS